MNRFTAEQLYALLPAIYRIRDFEEGDPLKSLLTVIAREAGVVQDDIRQLYENQFIETCDEWAVPYIGDLLGVRGLSAVGPGLYSQRGYVANTLAYRRRKGTVAVLEQLAYDVTGWSAKAVEYFMLLGTTQHINHVRPGNLRTLDVRNGGLLESIGTPFETTSHSADIRQISRDSGRYNIPNIGLFVWRLQPYTLEWTQAFSHGDGCFSFSPIGHDEPLFNTPETVSEDTGLAGRTSVPDRLDRRTLYEELEELRRAELFGHEPETVFFNDSPPFEIFLKDDDALVPIRPEDILICNLEDWTRPPTEKEYTDDKGDTTSHTIRVAVDPELGRLVFPDGTPGTVFTTYTYCFSGDIGGGPYDRPTIPERETALYQIKRVPFPSKEPDPDTNNEITSIEEAVAACNAWADKTATALSQAGEARTLIARIVLEGNRCYEISGGIEMTGSYHLVLQAQADCRPVLRVVDASGSITYLTISSSDDSDSKITFDGLLICGGIEIGASDPGGVVFSHCTLVPGLNLALSRAPEHPEKPSIVAESLKRSLALEIDHCILGPVFLPEENARLTIRDSIITSPGWNISARRRPRVLIDSAEKLFDVVARDRSSMGDAETRRASPASMHRADVLESSPLIRFPAISSPRPSMKVQIGPEHHTITLKRAPENLEETCRLLEDALQESGATSAHVAISNHRLLVFSDEAQVPIRFRPTPDDSTTVEELGLTLRAPAITSAGGDDPGPPVVLERVTVLGSVNVRECTLASNVIFTDLVTVKRRQTGCIRFSYVPGDSVTPARYYCQPDLAVSQRMDVLRKGGVVDVKVQEDEESRIRSRICPVFTAGRYGDPGFAQLGLYCDDAVTRGAEDGLEMGAFYSLRQPNRDDSLRIVMDEYLRLGLELGIIYAT